MPFVAFGLCRYRISEKGSNDLLSRRAVPRPRSKQLGRDYSRSAGLHPVGDTVADALADAKAAAMFHLEGLLQENLPIPEAQSIEVNRDNPDYADAVLWTMVEADDAALTGQVRFNVSWPQHILNRVDACTAARHETRAVFWRKPP
ncbi:TPA: type II toxin-antitoxin system HicB family antitoxin [Neisseria gonorrhoeae]